MHKFVALSSLHGLSSSCALLCDGLWWSSIIIIKHMPNTLFCQLKSCRLICSHPSSPRDHLPCCCFSSTASLAFPLLLLFSCSFSALFQFSCLFSSRVLMFTFLIISHCHYSPTCLPCFPDGHFCELQEVLFLLATLLSSV